MSYECEPRLPQEACANDIFVKVTNFPAGPITADPTFPPAPGSRIIKIPVKVALFSITEPLKDTIYIEGGFEDVKSIQRKVVLTQTHVTNNFLYVEGYILKNVGYSVPIYNDNPELCHGECKIIKNEYRDLTAKLDFHFTTPITLTNVISNTPTSDTASSYFVDCMKPCDRGTSGELGCEKYYSQTVTLNEPITSELEGYTINESVILKKDCYDSPWRYDTILEKLELTLSLALLQVQQIKVTTL